MSGHDELLLGVDFGTESCRAAVFDLDGRCLASEATGYAVSHPRSGWAEQDPDEWWSALCSSVRGVLAAAEVGPDAIGGVSVDATTHVYRAIQEGVCYGTAHNLRAMQTAGLEVSEMVAAGGFTNSPQLMQMQCDVSGVPITFTEVTEAVVLGGAILAAVGAGLFDSIPDAALAMVRRARTIEPDPEAHEQYRFFVDAYAETYPAMRPLMHRMSQRIAQQGAQSSGNPS